MRKYLLIASMVFFIPFGSYAYTLGFGSYNIEKTAYSILSLSQSYSSDNLSYGFTVNANLSGKDISVESLVVDSVNYDDGTYGVHYGPLEDYSIGCGLLVRGLDTSYYQPSFPTNAQKGLVLDYDGGAYSMEFFGTYGHLYGGQLKDSLFGIDMGVEFVSDTSLVSDEGFGRSATGAFVRFPLTDEIDLFTEAGTSSGGGEGSLAGLSFDYDLIFAYSRGQIAAASFNDQFIPGYFTSGYDIDPVQTSSLEAGARRYGTITSLDTGIIGLLNLKLTNENFTDGGSANSGSIIFSPIDNITFSGFVKELTFLDARLIKGKDANMIGGTIDYNISSGVSLSLNYRKTPLGDDGKPYDTSYCSLALEF